MRRSCASSSPTAFCGRCFLCSSILKILKEGQRGGGPLFLLLLLLLHSCAFSSLLILPCKILYQSLVRRCERLDPLILDCLKRTLPLRSSYTCTRRRNSFRRCRDFEGLLQIIYLSHPPPPPPETTSRSRCLPR